MSEDGRKEESNDVSRSKPDRTPTVVTVGNAVIDRTYLLSNLPDPDGGAYVEEYSEHPGGVEANVAAALRAFGYETGIISRLGDDDVGRAVLENLDWRGIDRRRVRVVEGEDSSYCLVLRNRAGERMIIGGGDGTTNLSLSDADANYLTGVDVAFTSGYVPGPVLDRLVVERRNGTLGTLAFDLAGQLSEIEAKGMPRETIDATLPAIDCFIGNEEAVASYTDMDEVDAAVDVLRSRGVSVGAITAGADGAILFNDDRIVKVPAFDIEIVDTTGAGDAFSAGLIHSSLLSECSLRQAGTFAGAVAAICCTAEGARGCLPDTDKVRNFLDARRGR